MTTSADPPSAAPPPRPVPVDFPINLGQFLKRADLASTGGEAKIQITTGHVLVNGEVETRRGRHLAPGDIVRVDGGDSVAVGCATDTQEAPLAQGPR